MFKQFFSRALHQRGHSRDSTTHTVPVIVYGYAQFDKILKSLSLHTPPAFLRFYVPFPDIGETGNGNLLRCIARGKVPCDASHGRRGGARQARPLPLSRDMRDLPAREICLPRRSGARPFSRWRK